MARKQKELPGLEREIKNPAVEEAAEAYCKVRDERSALSKKEKLAMLTLLATLKAQGLSKYEYLDDNGEILEALIEQGAEKAVVRKTGEAETEVGEGADSDDEESILDTAKRSAAKNQADVVVPETAAPKGKKARGGKGKPKP